MANVSKINGFSPVKHLNGSPYNGQATMYAHSSGDATALFVGDVVKLVGSGNAQGIQYITAATSGGAGTGAAAVGISATKAVVSSIVMIVLVDGIFAVISYKTGF